MPWHERLLGHAWLRKVLILLLLALAWEAMARYTDNDLLLPGAWQTARAFFQELGSGQLPARAALSFSVLFKGYAAGVALAFVLTLSRWLKRRTKNAQRHRQLSLSR